jgi:hypothetical protein
LDPAPRLVRRSLRKVYAMATLTNLANPKVVLFCLAFLPQLLSTGSGSWPVWAQLLFLGALFIPVGFPVDATVGFTAGGLAEKVLHRPTVRRWLDLGLRRDLRWPSRPLGGWHTVRRRRQRACTACADAGTPHPRMATAIAVG